VMPAIREMEGPGAAPSVHEPRLTGSAKLEGGAKLAQPPGSMS
jgi:hypothetical protein